MQTAEILKSIREKNKLTQDQMADRVMVSRQAVSRLENGEVSSISDIPSSSRFMMWKKARSQENR